MISFDIQLYRPDFSLHAAGEFDDGVTAIFGPSGAGKSSLLNCISGTIRPTSGSIELGGESIYSNAENHWVSPEHRRIGTVYQDGALFPHLSVRKNIEFGWRLMPENERRIAPLELAEFLGLSSLLDRMPNQLSGGERQRVAIARALATSPNLLLLDEPLASLDAARRGSILNYLKRVHAEYQIPMIYVSHSITEVVSIASKAMLLRDGKVEGYDRPSALLLGASARYDDIDGFNNILDGTVEASTDVMTTVKVGDVKISTRHVNKKHGENVVVSLGANQIILAADQPRMLSARNIFKGRTSQIWSRHGKAFIEVDIGEKLIAELTESAVRDLGIEVGNDVFLIFKSSSVDVYDA